MSWLECVHSNVFLKRLFPAGAPSLREAWLHGVTLGEGGTGVGLRFDIRDYPEHPPRKWHVTSNTVQIVLVGHGVERLVITGWGVNNVGALVIRRIPGAIEVEFEGGGCKLAASFATLSVASVTAYHDELRASI